MKDFIGHEVKSGDYVAVPIKGMLRIYQVQNIIDDNQGAVVELDTGYYAPHYFMSEQIAWIDPEKAMLSILES